jgi:type II secretory ATPase GspE/PulE/Tfp pilus assembly ATPase PilB-like protein
MVKRIALSALKGINGTVFMYGPTGCGKTFTMMGAEGIYSNNNEKKRNASCNVLGDRTLLSHPNSR